MRFRTFDDTPSAQHLFKVRAVLVVPESLSNESLRGVLEKLASEMMLDYQPTDSASCRRNVARSWCLTSCVPTSSRQSPTYS